MLTNKIIIDRTSVADALYELENLIREQMTPENLQYYGAVRRAERLRQALNESTVYIADKTVDE